MRFLRLRGFHSIISVPKTQANICWVDFLKTVSVEKKKPESSEDKQKLAGEEVFLERLAVFCIS